MTEHGTTMDHLERDNRIFQQRMHEEDSLQNQLRNQIQCLTHTNNDYLDQIAVVKREKEVEISRMIQEFKLEKEALVSKATKDA